MHISEVSGAIVESFAPALLWHKQDPRHEIPHERRPSSSLVKINRCGFEVAAGVRKVFPSCSPFFIPWSDASADQGLWRVSEFLEGKGEEKFNLTEEGGGRVGQQPGSSKKNGIENRQGKREYLLSSGKDLPTSS